MKETTTIMRSKALFSDDGKHRLLLRREWNKDSKTAMVIMINPNTADTLNMDLTTMLVLNNLTALGFGSVNIVNLYSRITPKLSLRFNSDDDLIEHDTDRIIEEYAVTSDAIIIAWGSVGHNSERVRERQAQVLDCISQHRNKMYQLGTEGFHPLAPAVRNSWELVPYEMEDDDDKNNKS